MKAWWAALWGSAVAHCICLAAMALLAAALLHLRRQARLHAAERWRERRLREELEAYAQVDPSLTRGLGEGLDTIHAGKALARRVCRVIAEKSAFNRVAMLLRNAEGRFACVGSVGVDDLTVAALHAWGEELVAEERGGGARAAARERGARSFSIALGEWHVFDREVSEWAMAGKRERRRWRRGIVAPIRTHAGRMVGAVVVCADGTAGGRRGGDPGLPGAYEKAMGPIEALAARIATAMENEAMAERLQRAEKLAGLGQLAGGVAHALNNPLTAVLGFAELIAETAADPRVRRDAETIQGEAGKMRDTVARLIEFWRPATLPDEAVALEPLLRTLADACEAKLRTRGVALELVAGTDTPTVRGSRERLRQVMEHLLNNAAQAIARSGPRDDDGEPDSIRVTLSHDERAVHIIVSDTGPGFHEPGRVFDPFYTTRGPESGAGMGLSICYGTVREHGGEISAFNLHPRGAAVVIELPVGGPVRERVLITSPVRQDEASAV